MQIVECLKTEHENSNYGVNRIFLWLQIHKGYKGSKRTIYRVCKENNLLIKRKFKPNGLTKADSEQQKSENLIKQEFTAEEPNKKGLTDITEIPCKNGEKLYLSAYLDCFDGSILSYEMDTNMKKELCINTLKRVFRNEKPTELIVHSDRGSQYTSHLFRQTLAKHGAIQSMSGTGRCYDNARMESFFATLKKEKLYKINTKEMSVDEVKMVVVEYIAYYNNRRIYSTNGGFPPLVYRKMYYEKIEKISA